VGADHPRGRHQARLTRAAGRTQKTHERAADPTPSLAAATAAVAAAPLAATLEAASLAATAATATVATVAGLGADLLGAGASEAPAPDPGAGNGAPNGGDTG
jgi:hypothetical protein